MIYCTILLFNYVFVSFFSRLSGVIGRRNGNGLNMQEYEGRIKLKFKLLANFYDLFDIPFRLNTDGNPRLALAQKIPNVSLRILDVCVGTANSAIAVAAANDQSEAPRLKRRGILKKRGGGLHPPYPRAAFIPAINGGVFCGSFIKSLV